MRIAAPLLLCMAVALPVATAPASAQFNVSRIITGKDPDTVRKLMQDEGYRAKLTPPGTDGEPATIESSTGGVNFRVRFAMCDEAGENCRAILFLSGFQDHALDSDTVETWNRDRFSKVYLDQEGDPFLEFSVLLNDGLNAPNLRDTLNWWAGELELFARETGWFDNRHSAQQPQMLVDDNDA